MKHVILAATILLISSSAVSGQSFLKDNLRSVDFSFGVQNSSFDYFDRTFWDFSSAPELGIGTEIFLTDQVVGRLGVGFSQHSSTIQREALAGREILKYSFVPIQIGLLFTHEFDMIRVLFGPDIEFINVRGSYDSPAGVQSGWGGTTALNLNASVEYNLDPVAISLYTKYKFGSFDQELQFEQGGSIATENINLNGFSGGIRISYIFNTSFLFVR